MSFILLALNMPMHLKRPLKLGLESAAASRSQIKINRANTTPLWRNGSAQDCGFALVPADKSYENILANCGNKVYTTKTLGLRGILRLRVRAPPEASFFCFPSLPYLIIFAYLYFSLCTEGDYK